MMTKKSNLGQKILQIVITIELKLTETISHRLNTLKWITKVNHFRILKRLYLVNPNF